MFLRFTAAIGLTTAIGLTVISIEKQNLSLKRKISLQHYQLEILREQRSRLFLETQRLGSPLRLAEEWDEREQTSRN